MYKFGARLVSFFLNVFLYMSSVCLANVQDFWMLLRIIFLTIMITACLELSQPEIYNSWMLLYSYLWLIIFDVLLLHMCFPLHVGGSGRVRLHISLN